MKKGLLLKRTEETEDKYYLGRIPDWIDFVAVDMGKGKYDEHLKKIGENLAHNHPELEHRIYISPTWRKEEIELNDIAIYMREWDVKTIYVRIRDSEKFDCVAFCEKFSNFVSKELKIYIYGAYVYPKLSAMMIEFAKVALDYFPDNVFFSPLVVWQNIEDPNITSFHKGKNYSPGIYIGDYASRNFAPLFQKAEKLYSEVFLFPAEGVEHCEVIEMTPVKKKVKTEKKNVWECVKSVALRKDPTPASKIVGRLQPGDIVSIVDKSIFGQIVYGMTDEGIWVCLTNGDSINVEEK
jgi:hypothetical protein